MPLRDSLHLRLARLRRLVRLLRYTSPRALLPSQRRCMRCRTLLPTGAVGQLCVQCRALPFGRVT